LKLEVVHVVTQELLEPLAPDGALEDDDEARALLVRNSRKRVIGIYTVELRAQLCQR
jgi:hypothetical protein